jgi:hypothetical protein
MLSAHTHTKVTMLGNGLFNYDNPQNICILKYHVINFECMQFLKIFNGQYLHIHPYSEGLGSSACEFERTQFSS